ncbi:MAG: hypothetical protein R2800_08650 [Flavipsychrobacter sp.]
MKKYGTLSLLLVCTALLFACKKIEQPTSNVRFQSSFNGTIDQDSFVRMHIGAEAYQHPTIAGKYQLIINGNEYTNKSVATYRTFYIYLEEFNLTPDIYLIKPTTTTGVNYNHAYYDAWWGPSGPGPYFPFYSTSGFVNIQSIANGKMKGNLQFTTEKGQQIEGNFYLKLNM